VLAQLHQVAPASPIIDDIVVGIGPSAGRKA
jgi:hypothetical protein